MRESTPSERRHTCKHTPSHMESSLSSYAHTIIFLCERSYDKMRDVRVEGRKGLGFRVERRKGLGFREEKGFRV